MAADYGSIRGNGSPEDFSLESILAEYKGSAYIDGDKKTPVHVLNEKTEKIIMEVTGENASEAMFSSGATETYINDGGDYSVMSETAGNPETVHDSIVQDSKYEGSDTSQYLNYAFSSKNPQPDITEEVEKAISKETEIEQQTRETAKKVFRIFKHGRNERFGDAEGQHSEAEEDQIYVEPDFKEAARYFAERCNSVSLRFTAAFLVSVIMAVLMFAFEAEMILPFGIGRSRPLTTGMLVIMQLIVMMLGTDIIIRGVRDAVRAAPNAESLVLFSCFTSLISGVFSIVTDVTAGLPFCTVSAFSLTFTLLGEKYFLRALADTLKTSVTSSEPYGVAAEFRQDINKTVLKKVYKRTDGFYNNLMHPDITETAYRYASPLMLTGALVLSVFTVLAKDSCPYLLHILSAMFAASASFSAVLAFSLPFASVARSARRSGAAIAGWGGADDICRNDGVCVTDDDMFPPGTLSLGGLKIFEEISPEKAIRYTSSLIIASGSGLSRVFSELLTKQGMNLIRVEDFACYEGGIGALIRGERVMTGSAAFMNLLGIRIPDDINMKNAVFTAVNDKLIAMFAVNYVPVNSVQRALITIIKWRVKLFFAVRDFNITPLMLRQKFKVSTDDIEYIPAQNSYSMSEDSTEGSNRIAAVLTREGLGPLGEAITASKLLRTSTLISTVLSVVTSVFGMLVMFYICWVGAFETVRPGNLLIFMLSMLAAVLVACGYVKCKK